MDEKSNAERMHERNSSETQVFNEEQETSFQDQSVQGAGLPTDLSGQQPGAARQPDISQAPGAAQPQATSGLAIAGMVLGIVALLTVFLPFINIGSPVIAIVGLVLSIAGYSGIKKGKKKGKGIAVAGIVLCAIVTVLALLVSAACSAAVSSSGSNDSGNSVSSGSVRAESSASSVSADAQVVSEPASTAAQSTSPSAEAGNKADFVGTWDAVSFPHDGQTYNEEQISAARAAGNDYYITFDEDGSGTYAFGGKPTSLAWEMLDASSIAVKLDDERTVKLVLDGDALNAEDASFRRGEARSNTRAESEDSGSPDSDSTINDEVSPDLKEMLDSYEAFMDEYVKFMKEYKESGNTTSMLASYAEYMQKYGDLMQKIESVDTDNLSASDYAYYIEVTSRISQKLLETM